MGGICLALENGFHLLIINQIPDTVSPKFRGELSSILHSLSHRAIAVKRYTHRCYIGCESNAGAHRKHRRDLCGLFRKLSGRDGIAYGKIVHCIANTLMYILLEGRSTHYNRRLPTCSHYRKVAGQDRRASWKHLNTHVSEKTRDA